MLVSESEVAQREMLDTCQEACESVTVSHAKSTQMTKMLRDHGLGICLSLAVVITAILSLHTVMTSMLPIADGQGYVMRTFALYGFLHTGQWSQFVDLLTRPCQSILAPHDLLFFLLPRSLAGVAAYVTLQNGVTNLLLAYGVHVLSQVLNRPAWAPAIFLLCAVNNIALTDFYAFYLDMSFLAVGLLAIAFQMKAWSGNHTSTSAIAGALVGSMFFIKPANALIFLAIYLLSELIHAAFAMRKIEAGSSQKKWFQNLVKDDGWKFSGLVPALLLAFCCGGGQTILQLIEQNEVTRELAAVSATGLLRLFYFPLCLSVCYHVILLGGLLILAVAASKWFPAKKSDESLPSYPVHLFVPILIAYFIYGEFFSFWMIVKPMRALLLMLPLLWFCFFWMWEKRHLRIEPLLVVALLYAGLAFSQKAFDFMGTRDQLVEDNYQLSRASWTEMPSAWHRGVSLNQMICDFVVAHLPPPGIICANAIEIRNTLDWRLGKEPLLEGKTPPYPTRNLFDFKGEYYDQSLLGASEVVLVTFLPVQSSRTAWLQSMGAVDYANEQWCGSNPLARRADLGVIHGQSIGQVYTFNHPLTAADVALANKSAPFATAPRADADRWPDSIYGRHFNREQTWHLLRAWFARRFL